MRFWLNTEDENTGTGFADLSLSETIKEITDALSCGCEIKAGRVVETAKHSRRIDKAGNPAQPN